MIASTMPLVDDDQFSDDIHVLYNASGTTIFLLAEVLLNADVLIRVGTDYALLKSNSSQLEQVLNVRSSMLVTPFPIVTLVSPQQP